jgi:hypothetical protein
LGSDTYVAFSFFSYANIYLCNGFPQTYIMSKSFVEQVFMTKYYPLLNARAETFKLMFEYLESLNKQKYNILETGCCRLANNFDGDGMSTVIFDEFINFYDGLFCTVDINQDNINFAKSQISDKSVTVCDDSVFYINKLSKVVNPFDGKQLKVDLLYLDSFDIDDSNPHPSAFHHFKEFLAAQPIIGPGTLVVVDDHKNDSLGKGMYLLEYMNDLNHPTYFKQYQISWLLT